MAKLRMGFTEQPHPKRRGTNNVNNKFYINKRTANTLGASIGIFLLILTIAKERNGLEGFVFAFFAAFLVYVILNPKISWQFILDRIRKLGKAIRGEE